MIGRAAPLLLLLALAPSARAQSPLTASLAGEPVAAPAAPGIDPAMRKRVFGRSGALRVFPLRGPAEVELPYLRSVLGPAVSRFRWMPLFGTRAPLAGQPAFSADLIAPGATGMWRLEAEHASDSPMLTVVTEVPFSAKRGGFLNGYHIGSYPTEGAGRTDVYAPPPAFIEVTPENQDAPLSEHFHLRQFLTHDQGNVWPKYVALRLELIDKLELVLQELQRMGIRADRMHVMSGFRTPQYNGPGGDGRAALSRHMYGDAADVWVDSDGDGYTDDLNGDGARDRRDVEVVLRAVERVEQKHPELMGGAGLYYELGTRSPFIHIDVRGTPTRW